MQFKHLFAGLGITTIAAAGSLTAAFAGGSSAHAATLPAARAHVAPATVPMCASSQLSAQVTDPNGGGAAGSTYDVLNLVNTSSTTCTTFGWPGVSFIDGNGNQVGAAADRTPSSYEPTVTVAPGHAAQAVLRVADAGNFDPASCGPTATSALRIYPPDQTAPITATFQGQACANPADHLLSIGELEAGPADGGTGPTT